MTDARWDRVKELFTTALDMNAHERMILLTEKCAGDEELRREVESLLAADALHSTLFDTPIADIVAAHMVGSSSSQQAEGLKVGTILDGRYRIREELGRGGMGLVYLATREHMLGDKVVVKLLLEKHLQNRYVLQKFRQEMESLLRVEHTSIVRLLDAGQTAQGTPYLVMEYVEGHTLHREIPAEGMNLLRAAHIVRQVGLALRAAHHKRVFHRDLKPQNIMLCLSHDGEEQAKIIDFGVAKIKNSLVAPSTIHQITVGTVAYMAPEQLDGKPVSAESDIYALGVIAYEMVTGRRPFVAESIHQLMELQRAGVAVRPAQLRPALPKGAEAVILKALSYNPEDRHRQADEFGEEFWRAVDAGEEESPARPNLFLKRGRGRALLLASALLFLFLAGSIIFWKTRPAATAPGNGEVQPTAPAERSLNYWIEVQKYRAGKPYEAPFRLAGEINFESDYHLRLHLNSPQQGHLYILNERPSAMNGAPAYNLLFPDPTINGGSTVIGTQGEIEIPKGNWFVFDEETGVEKLWLIYAAQSVAEMEDVRGVVNSADKGFIRDPRRALAIQKFILERGAPKPEVKMEEERRQTVLKSNGDVLVHLIRLEHH